MSISYLCTSCHQCRIRAHFCLTCIDFCLTYKVILIQGFMKSKRVLQRRKEQYRIIPQHSTRCSPYETTSDYQSMRWVPRQWRSTLGVWKKLDDRFFCFISETRVQVAIELRVFWQTSLVVIVCVFLSRVRNPHQTFSCWESLSSRVVWRYLSDLRASHTSLSHHTVLATVHTIQDTKYHTSKSF